MVYDSSKHNRQSIRLKNFDYSQNGYYFLTIMCKNREHLFGEIVNSDMIYNDAGKHAIQCWEEIPKHFPNVILHEYIVMPNYVHGIIQIKNENNIGVNDMVEVENFQPLPYHQQPKINQFQKIIPRSLGSIVRGFKIGVTKWFRLQGYKNDVWQRNYFEKIIFEPATYSIIEDYIKGNPKNFKG